MIMYELKPVTDRAPVVGEMRYIVPLMPSSWEPLASMMPADCLVRVIWDGIKWQHVGVFAPIEEKTT